MKRNVTLSLPEPLLHRFKIYAATRDRSMTQLVAEAIEQMIDQQEEREKISRRMIERMENSPSRGTGGVISWTRDEIHER